MMINETDILAQKEQFFYENRYDNSETPVLAFTKRQSYLSNNANLFNLIFWL